MLIDFFKSDCQGTTEQQMFGLCDDPAPATNPAYIDENDSDKWIAEVKNEDKKQVVFTAIDHCIEILRPNGDQESRCDGVLTSEDAIIFIELKDRAAKHGWVRDGRNQLKTTILKFLESNTVNPYTRKEGYVANKQRPFFNNGVETIAAEFKDDTGFVLRIRRDIEI